MKDKTNQEVTELKTCGLDNPISLHENVFYLNNWVCKHMELLNSYIFYTLGYQVHALIDDLTIETNFSDAFSPCFFAETVLDPFLKNQKLPLPLSKQSARKLLDTLRPIMVKMEKEHEAEWGKKIGWQGHVIKEAAKEFEHILSAELSQIELYLVSQKGIYATKYLIERADEVLTQGVRSNVPQQALDDLKQAGKCLAFDLPTAVGFHLFRAAESVIREYCKILSKGSVDPKQKTWANYIEELKKLGADEKVTGVLDQMRDMHRNPTMHPDVVLTPDEAVTLFGMTQSAITAMVADMNKHKALPTVMVRPV